VYSPTEIEPPNMKFPDASLVLALAVLSLAAERVAQDAAGKDSITLAISVERQLFAADATLDVQVWSAAQIAALTNNERCASTRDTRTGTERTSCPDGITYQPVVPQQVHAPLGGVTNAIEIRLASVKAGESFRVAVSGLSRDGCNTTSATAVRTASSGRNSLMGLAWQTTTRACLKER
jgi:hypothetical protein